jgi:hypothetical protein
LLSWSWILLSKNITLFLFSKKCVNNYYFYFVFFFARILGLGEHDNLFITYFVPVNLNQLCDKQEIWMIFCGLSSCCSYQLGEKKWNLYTPILVRVPLEINQVFLTIHGVHISPKRKLFYNARLIKEEDWSIRATTTNPTRLQVVFFRFLTISSWFWWWRKGFLRIIVHDGMSNFCFGEGEKDFFFFFLGEALSLMA